MDHRRGLSAACFQRSVDASAGGGIADPDDVLVGAVNRFEGPDDRSTVATERAGIGRAIVDEAGEVRRDLRLGRRRAPRARARLHQRSRDGTPMSRRVHFGRRGSHRGEPTPVTAPKGRTKGPRRLTLVEASPNDDGTAESVRRVAIEHHDALVSTFETLYRDRDANRFASAFAYGRSKIDAVLDAELARRDPGARLLDVGCGTGVHVRLYRDRGFDAVGLEPAPAMLEVARQNNPDAEIVEGDVTALPFDDGEFDFVTAIEVFRYLFRSDTRAGLSECRRVLRPGGTVFLTMVNRWSLDGFYLLQRARQAPARHVVRPDAPALRVLHAWRGRA